MESVCKGLHNPERNRRKTVKGDGSQRIVGETDTVVHLVETLFERDCSSLSSLAILLSCQVLYSNFSEVELVHAPTLQ